MRLSEIAEGWRNAKPASVHVLVNKAGLSGSDSEAEARAEEIFAVLDDPSSLDVLDYAAGPGRLSVLLASRFRSVTLADINPNFLRLAEERFNQVGLSNYSTKLLVEPSPNVDAFERTFDVFVSDLFLSHLPIDVAVDFMALFRDLLNPGGWLFIGQPIYEADRDPTHWSDISTWTVETFERLAAGFDIVELFPNAGPFMGRHGPNHFRLHVLRRPTSG